MTTIIVMHDDQELDTLDFPLEMTSISLGRRPTNDVHLADRSVSGNHARLDITADSITIEDLSSTNGTYLNGRPVQRSVIGPDDEVLVGKVQLQVRAGTRIAAVPTGDEPAQADTTAPAARERDQDVVTESAVSAVAAGEAAGDAAAAGPMADPLDDDDDDLDASMRAALALYSEDEEPAPAAAVDDDEDDDIDFSEDARLFAQSSEPVAEAADTSASFAASGREPADDSMSLSARAKVALGREPAARPYLHAVPGAGQQAGGHAGRQGGGHAGDQGGDQGGGHAGGAGNGFGQGDTAVALRPGSSESGVRSGSLDDEPLMPTHELDGPRARSRGAVIEIKNGAKSGQILPIDKPVTTLGRPGIQIAAIMRKPDGYFLMHIESDDSVDRPTLNADLIGDEPVLLHSGDELNVAGIDVEFMLS